MDFVREVKLLAAQARRNDRKMRLFCVSSHKYDFATTISIYKLRKFEGEYYIKLPENFARYLTEI